MLTGTTYKIRNIQNVKAVSLVGCELMHVSSVKFLGITIDATLSWKPHIDDACKICSRNVGILNKVVKYFLPKTSLYKLYCTLIMPYLTYGILLCGNASKEYVTKLFSSIPYITCFDFL